METYSMWPTSATTADCDPIVLRESEHRRLVFKPLLLHNSADSEAPLRGTFVFQRKRKADSWEDHNELPLTKLKAEEWIRLDLSASELRELLSHLAALYRFYRKHGLPRRRVTFLKVDVSEDDADAVREIDFDRLLRLGRTAGFDVVGQFMHWVGGSGDARLALQRLGEMDPESLDRIGSLAQLASLRSTVQEWAERLNGAEEEYWQGTLERNAFVLSQMLAHPLIIVSGKAYVGGKGVDNKGGHLADLLAKNPLTGNAAIVEIKTPAARLLGSEYRAGIFPLSDELSGAVSQALTYRYSLMTKYHHLVEESEEDFDVFHPQVIIIGGNGRRELGTKPKRRSFELARNGLKDVTIITFDELVENARILVDALVGATV